MRSLNVSNCKHVREPEIKLISARLTQLEGLDISTSSGKCALISDELCVLLNQQKDKLITVKMAGWRPPYRGLFESLSQLRKLETLDISDFEIKTVRQLLGIISSVCRNLRILRMCRVTVLTNNTTTLPAAAAAAAGLPVNQVSY